MPTQVAAHRGIDRICRGLGGQPYMNPRLLHFSQVFDHPVLPVLERLYVSSPAGFPGPDTGSNLLGEVEALCTPD